MPCLWPASEASRVLRDMVWLSRHTGEMPPGLLLSQSVAVSQAVTLRLDLTLDVSV